MIETTEERLKVFEEIDKQFEQLKIETNYVYLNRKDVYEDFTVGHLKKYLNEIPDDYIVCKTVFDEDIVEYSSIQVLTAKQKQTYLDFECNSKESGIITFY